MSGTTISTTVTTHLELTNPAQGPVLITEGGAIELGPQTIFGGRYGPNYDAIYASSADAWSITNFGTVFSEFFVANESGPTRSTGSGINLFGGGEVTNGSHYDTNALIQSIFLDGGTIFNDATISPERIFNPATIASGPAISGGGDITIINGSATDTAANISGETAIETFGTTDIDNYATISGQALLNGAGTVINGSPLDTGALMQGGGGKYGGVVESAGSVINYGMINGGSSSVGVIYSANLLNLGTILGYEGVKFEEGFGGTVENEGLIEGASGTAISQVQLLKVDNNGIFIGNVIGEGSQHGNLGTLELKAGTASGDLSGIGTSFTGFVTIAIDAGAAWTLSGDATGLAAGQKIDGFSANDTIVLDGFTTSSHTFVSGSGLELTGAAGTETLNFSGISQPSAFLVTDTGAGTEISICYLRGTLILTGGGEVPVEGLNIGDMVETRQRGLQPIKWIGRQSFRQRFIANNQEQWPVRIMEGALGSGLPRRALIVSPGHSLLLGGTLILAKYLVNGVTIHQETPGADVEYYNIELEAHDCVLAEGSWAESYADCVGLRAKFHNAREFARLYPFHLSPDEPRLCAPRPLRGKTMEKALLPVAARAAGLTKPGRLRGWVDRIDNAGRVYGWAVDAANPSLPVVLEVLARGKVVDELLAYEERPDVAESGIGKGNCGFQTGWVAGSGFSVRRKADRAELAFSHALAGRAA